MYWTLLLVTLSQICADPKHKLNLYEGIWDQYSWNAQNTPTLFIIRWGVYSLRQHRTVEKVCYTRSESPFTSILILKYKAWITVIIYIIICISTATILLIQQQSHTNNYFRSLLLCHSSVRPWATVSGTQKFLQMFHYIKDLLGKEASFTLNCWKPFETFVEEVLSSLNSERKNMKVEVIWIN